MLNISRLDNACLFYDQHGAARADVYSVATSSRLDSIRSVYGVSVAHNLIEIEISDDDPSSSIFEMDGFVSNSNYVAKKTTLVLFINGIYFLYIPLETKTGLWKSSFQFS